MKNSHYLLFVLFVLMFTACKKEKLVQNLKSETQLLWVTPNGFTIPYEESHRWREYVAEHMNQVKSDPPKKKYESFYCQTPTVSCGLTCIQSTINNCTEAFPCLPCVNCPCSM
jgi:hypothetical protein